MGAAIWLAQKLFSIVMVIAVIELFKLAAGLLKQVRICELQRLKSRRKRIRKKGLPEPEEDGE